MNTRYFRTRSGAVWAGPVPDDMNFADDEEITVGEFNKVMAEAPPVPTNFGGKPEQG